MLLESYSDKLIQMIKRDGSMSRAHPGYERMPTEATPQGTKSRRAMASCVNDTLSGNFFHLVDEKLQNRFHPQTYQAMALQSGTRASHNVMVDAIDRLDESTWPSARYELQDIESDEPADDVESKAHEEMEKRLERWVEVAKPDQLAQRVSRLLWVHPAVCVMPWVAMSGRTGTRKFTWIVLDPSSFDLIPSRTIPGDWEALQTFAPVSPGDRVEQMTEWRADSVKYYERKRASDSSDREDPWHLVREESNPFGVVPAVIFQSVPGKLWSDNYGPMLLESTIEVNCAQTLLTYNAAGQVKVMLGALDNMKSGQVLRHGALVDVPGTGTLQVGDLTTDVQSFAQTFIRDERTAVATALGLPADEFYSTAVAPSGESLKLRYWTRTLRARKHRDALLPKIQECYALSLHVINTALSFTGVNEETGAAMAMPPIERVAGPQDLPPYDVSAAYTAQPYGLAIDVEDLQPPETQQEREARIDFDISQGFTTAAKILQAENPDIKDAEAVIKENLSKTQEMRQMKSKTMGPQPGQAPSFGGPPMQAQNKPAEEPQVAAEPEDLEGDK